LSRFSNEMIPDKSTTKIILLLFKDFSTIHTITSISDKLKISRVGVWKIIKKLESKKYLCVLSVGSGKTSTSTIKINWDNILVEKSLALYLTEEAQKQKRWLTNFAGLEKVIDFVILYGSITHSPKQAKDIDIVVVTQKKMLLKTQVVVDNIQKTLDKKVHGIYFTPSEFEKELQKPNKAFIGAVKTGIVLFGQEKFIKFMKKVF